MSSDATTGGNIAIAIVSVITVGIVMIVVSVLVYKCYKLRIMRKYGGLPLPAVLPTVEMRTTVAAPIAGRGGSTARMASGTISSSSYGAVDVVKDRPVRFSSLQLQEFTGNYAEKLGAGGFGVVFRGQIPLPDHGSLQVAVKVLGSNMGRRAEEQFMAEIGTIGRTSHVNLVRLYGFCFDTDLKALVYEFMPNGSLDRHLFHDDGDDGNGGQLMFDKLYDVAVGTAKAIRYLHDDCERRIIHYDIKPGNVLLDEAFRPKVADFGLARLCERERTHMTMTGGGRGTPGYAAPELWMAAPATHKCDVYSYGMLLFEILGRRRNYVDGGTQDESAERWYPRWAWQRLERGETEALAARALAGKAGKEGRKKVERMCTVALWCVQYRPEDRPPMSGVVRMLEGDEDVAAPAVSPFAHLDSDHLVSQTFTADTTTTFGSAA
ncbi:G-type lectin S-receptor-like serine/threonine-protein kinase [Panicum miliaceum]|uniref:G-type lectin S-receptor-like serine/threonine-protein kinase n=1 Tax=Panicum miliaceum TaxID=4540 RepID=A0A3L6RIN8_PANMI|nr:G-type lectin S-receptor-like serine/threonine-protein kinase [Panicum miliaceum]